VASVQGRVVDTLLGLDELIDAPGANATGSTPVSGNYSNGVLTLAIDSVVVGDLSDVLPDLLLQLTVNGTVVTNPVPEPSSFALAALGIVGVATVARRCAGGV
jgi:hypothetical protein